ncbi:sodium-dependent glucose transporter 1A [Aplysia californica]|uniref:Sodium-dependent glucose transporter 1A n=1 Tax=Aplysia californica TaxID=6500 RepID=A0ABM1A583_APLCA|nr:sodium-dependent glucose transporter 1A [Aplysia californica]
MENEKSRAAEKEDEMLELKDQNRTESEALNELTKQSQAKSRWVGWRQKFKDKEYRRKLLRTLWLTMALFSWGISDGQIGPTVLDLQIITSTGVKEGSAFIMARRFGYMAGALMRAWISRKIHTYLLLLVSLLGLAGFTLLIPHCSVYPAMVAMLALCGVSGGFIATSCNSELMGQWGEQGRSLMQLMHFGYAVGGVLGPLLSKPFLAVKRDTQETINSEGVRNDSQVLVNSSSFGPMEIMTFVNGTFNSSFQDGGLGNFPASDSTTTPTTHIQYAFLISGVIFSLTALPIFGVVFQERSRLFGARVTVSAQSETGMKTRTLPVCLRLFLVCCVCVFFSLHAAIEDTFTAYLMTFLVKEYREVTKAFAAYVTSIYWISFASFRLLMAFLSRFASPPRLMGICLSIVAMSLVCFTISASFGQVTCLVVFTVTFAIGICAVYPSVYSLCESEIVPVSIRLTSAFSLCAGTGSMLNPLLVAYLMDTFGNMWYCYTLLSQISTMLVFFVFLLSFVRCYVSKSYGPLRRYVSGTIHSE